MGDDPAAPPWLRQGEAVQVLRHVWIQHFHPPDATDQVEWRCAADLPPAPLLISSPYDCAARYSKQRTTAGTGYQVHLTETCDDDQPNLITDVQTTLATTPEHAGTDTIQQQLAARDLLPRAQIVDAGYVIADQLVASQTRGVDLVGPTPPEPGWQAQAREGCAASQFVIDWDAQVATCPAGKTSVIGKPTTNAHAQTMVHIRFAHQDCKAGPVREKCVSSTRARALTIRAHDQNVALQAARQRQTTDAFKATLSSRKASSPARQYCPCRLMH